jgi:hypothetical protein
MVEFVETFVNEDVKKVFKVLHNSLQSFLKKNFNRNYFKVSNILGFRKGCYYILQKEKETLYAIKENQEEEVKLTP